MPIKPSRPCRYPECGELVNNQSGYCSTHQKLVNKSYDISRETSTQRGYNTRWRIERKQFLEDNPLCVECIKKGKAGVMANTVDHIIPHRGNMELFWDKSNRQSLCESHHNQKTRKGM